MEINVSGKQTHGYSVAIPVFEGPLDLLLKLIEHSELEITAVSLSMVTDQYLTHIRQIDNSKPEQISAFLVIAAKLIQIKSEALLPRPPTREDSEEDPAQSLVEQLRLYKKFKEMAEHLYQLEQIGKHTYKRGAIPIKLDGKLDLSELTLDDLVSAAQAIFQSERDKKSLSTVIAAPKVTIRQKINYLTNLLSGNDQVNFDDIMRTATSRLEIVVTFLALLELVKRHRVVATQQGIFSNIAIEKSELWVTDEDFELEFE